ncbi:RusA family crossover junction endodeoxyribonuclease [Rhodopseudomonas sp. B29]|uniref:RusA family crossover junction endodeoxyribonuclease n=1 Tax=Rhodopseudomonas sp. B29 TaxID=95607 RepID=UPI00034AD63F|nr:RusA family crossover junction endodeoxyribonuclease [Rhodopseudomonas sp. B29]
MTDPVTIIVAGDPQGKGRARAFRRGNFIGHYTPEKTRTYEGIIRSLAMDAMSGRLPIEAPVEIDLSIIFAVPASWSQKKRAQAIAGEIKPAKKPDADNVIKAFTDAMNGVVFKDDAQIVAGRFAKAYGPAAVVVATVREVV